MDWGQPTLKKHIEVMPNFIGSPPGMLWSKERLATQLKAFVGLLEELENPVS